MEKFEELSPLALAFLGDSVHTMFVREKVLLGQTNKLNNYHNLAKKFCNAKAQMLTLEKIASTLSNEESEVVRKARNAHSKHGAKNYDEETYKKATAFESLIGFLYLSGQKDRLKEILEISIQEN